MNPDLEKLIELSYSFRAVDRDIYYPGQEKAENDAEHAYQLTLLAWHVMELDGLKLDQAKVFKLCLAHDLVEVHSGDVPLWGKAGHDEKAERELAALNTLKESFGKTPELAEAIAEYKARETDEAKFVYGLDKLIPFLNQLKTEGRIWKAHDVTLDQAVAKLEAQGKASEYLTKYFDEALAHLKANESTYFN